jgi:hypothetical protein
MLDTLKDKYVEFAAKQYTEYDWRRLPAYQMQIEKVADDTREELIQKTTAICDRILNGDCEQAQLTNIGTMVRWACKSYYLIGLIEVDRGLARNDEAIAKQGMNYLEKTRKLYKDMGNRDELARVQAGISTLSSRCIGIWGPGFCQAETAEDALERHRVCYESMINQHGEAHELTIIIGRDYAVALYHAAHHIEAWRLFNKLIPLSQQSHGSEHLHTVKLKEMLDIIQTHRVRVQNLNGRFQAIRYEGDQCVVRVLTKQQGVQHGNKRLIKVKANDIIPSKASPVVCHGLKNASHLNGKIGDVRGFDEDEMRCEVHFEDKNILPKCVKPENLRILFVLPESTDA